MFKKKGHEVSVLVLTRGEASGDPAPRENECKLAAATIGVDRLFFGNLVHPEVTPPDAIIFRAIGTRT